MEKANVPDLPLRPCDSKGKEYCLNAFALDFFKHQSIKAIEKENM